MITWYFIIGAIYTISLLISFKCGYILHIDDHKSKKALDESDFRRAILDFQNYTGYPTIKK